MTGRLALATIAFSMGVGAQDLVEGRAGSPVRVVIYEDLQCGDCAAFRAMMDSTLLPRYGAAVAFVHRDFPLPKHTWARRAAIAARYFARRDPKTALEYRRHTLATRREITDTNFEEKLAGFARARGLDPREAVAALQDPALAAAVEKDYQEGIARGIARTPTVLVDGRPFIETFTLEEISRGIDQALEEAK